MLASGTAGFVAGLAALQLLLATGAAGPSSSIAMIAPDRGSLGALGRFFPLSRSPPSASLDPFDQPGQIQVTLGDPDNTFWQPWDPKVQPSKLLTDLRRDLRSNASETETEGEWEWLRGRTVAVLGDSIDRDHVEYCACAADLNQS